MNNYSYYECLISISEAEKAFWKSQKKIWKIDALKRSTRRPGIKGCSVLTPNILISNSKRNAIYHTKRAYSTH
jgi:hypothetical protein